MSNAAEWIYIGQTDNIRRALQHHLEEAEGSIMKRHPTGFVFEICDQAHCRERQGRLVTEYAPACNRGGESAFTKKPH